MRPAAQWCTLCYVDLRPTAQARVVAETPDPELVSVPEAPRDDVATAEQVAAIGRGKHAKGASSEEQPGAGPAPAPDEKDLGVEAMLALLAAETRRPIPGLGGVARKLDSGGGRTALMAGGIVAFSAVLFVLMAIVGSLL